MTPSVPRPYAERIKKSIRFLFLIGIVVFANPFYPLTDIVKKAEAQNNVSNLDFLQNQQYTACIQQAHQNPEDAFELSLQWEDENGGLPARHCNALALMQLEQYPEAAKRLQALASSIPETVDPQIVAEILGQAGLALYLDGQLSKALEVQNAAIKLYDKNTDLLIDRAFTEMDLGDLPATISDLNAVLVLDPDHLEALTYRASAYRYQEKFDLALTDLNHVISLQPKHPDALLERGIIYRLQGKNNLAREDWLNVIEYHDGRPVAEMAQQNLQKMELEK